MASPAGYPPNSGGQQPPMAPLAWYPPTESNIGGSSPHPGYSPAAGLSTAYPVPPPPARYPYGAPPPAGYPPTHGYGYPGYDAPPPAGYPGALPPQGYRSQPPPPTHGYGPQPPPPGAYGYPGYGAPPPAGYPGFGTPPPAGYSGYATPPVQQPPQNNSAGLLRKVLIGSALGDIIESFLDF